MALEAPLIDDRRYDDILREVRARIPRYTNEWTDQNDSDPGMILSQLVAWMSDMLLYRLGRVPELHYVKFLQLLGFELHPAAPAKAEVTFPVRAGALQPYVIVPLRTQIAAEEPDDDGQQIVFETDRAINAIRAQLKSVMVELGAAHSLLTSDNVTADQPFQPFGASASPNSALLLGFSEALPRVEIDLAVWVYSQTTTGAARQRCGEPPRLSFSAPPIMWEFWDGRAWTNRGVALVQDETAAFTRSGHVRLKVPGSDMREVEIKPESQRLYWLRARLTRSIYDVPPKLRAIRTNTVSVTQAETVRDEILGGSDASPDQTFRLAESPVLAGSLKLEIDEGPEERQWTEVADLFSCRADDACYTLNRTTGEVRFGNGVKFGAIPLANPQNRSANIVATEYRVGGGSRGNVKKINSMLTGVDGIEQKDVLNLFPSEGGSDEEPLRDLEQRARQELQHRGRAVAAEDFEALAKEAANIARAKALPLFHPSFPNIEVPGVVTVIVIPHRSHDEQRDPSPGTVTLESVCRYLDDRRLLTSEVYVLGPTYRHVEIKGDVFADDDADLAALFNAIESDLKTFLDPLTGGRDGSGWPLGGTVYYSQIVQRIAAIDGVRRVGQLTIVIDGKEQPRCVDDQITDVTIGKHELVYSTSHGGIVVDYDTQN